MSRLILLTLLLPALLTAAAASAQEASEDAPPGTLNPPYLNEAAPPEVTLPRLPEPKPWIAPKRMIDINPLALLNGQLSLELERALGTHGSILIGSDVLVFRGIGNPLPKDMKVFGGALKLGIHVFPWGNALNGFWVGPELVGLFAGVNGPEGKGIALGFEADAALGYTFIVAEHLGISVGAGAGYRVISLTTQRADGTTDGKLLHGLALTGRLAIGYAF